MLPNFLIIGAEKSGTTWLYKQLKSHPEIFFPDTKELHYFNQYNSNFDYNDRFDTLGLQYYRRFFDGAHKERAVGEVTPMYLCDPKAPTRVHTVLPDVKLICCLRNPADRAYSHYWMARRKGHVNMLFKDVVQRRDERFIKRGLYAQQLARYLEFFPREKILVLVYEEVMQNPQTALEYVARFLSVDPGFIKTEAELQQRVFGATDYRSAAMHNIVNTILKRFRRRRITSDFLDTMKHFGAARLWKHLNQVERSYPAMPQSMRRQLDDIYRADIQRLNEEFGVNVGNWQRRNDWVRNS